MRGAGNGGGSDARNLLHKLERKVRVVQKGPMVGAAGGDSFPAPNQRDSEAQEVIRRLGAWIARVLGCTACCGRRRMAWTGFFV